MKTMGIKEPVRIRLKELKNGSKSIYLDCYMGKGRREYKFLNIYLHPERTKEDKAWNMSQMQLANAIKAQYIIRYQNGEYGFQDNGQMKKMNFIEFCNKMIEDYRHKGQNSCAVLMEYAVRRMISYKGKNITFGQIDKKFLLGFIDFLNTDSRDYDKKKKISSRKTISDEYKVQLYARIMTALNKAVREGIIVRNPGHDIDSSSKPKTSEKARNYLTMDEIQMLINTPYRPKNHIKEAFLFCCFCGLRFSDVNKLTWGEIKTGADGLMQLETRMKKTGKELYLPLSENALRWLPERGTASDKDRVFSNLPDQACHANCPLKTLTKRAGISKHVTFHVARHTFATLILTFGADLYTVSKLLGHTKVQTTQIYAKVVDESKRKAVDLIPKL